MRQRLLVTLFFLALAANTTTGLACGTRANTDPNLIAWAHYYAIGFGLDPHFFEALVWAESRFCVDALSSAGAIGLTQITPGTAAGLGVDPSDPLEALWGGAKYLRDQYLRFGDWTLALAAYNAGPGRVVEYGGVPPFTETHEYIQRVFSTYRTLKGL
jgi:soluble lytic murein transglycosylase-like protein